MTKQPMDIVVEERDRIPLPALQEDFGGNKNYHLVKLPEEVTEELAENVGIHISDGSMRINGTNSRIQYSGHAIDDFPYYIFRFVPLLKRLWGTNRIYCEGLNDKQTIVINIYSKQLASFKHEVLELPYGKKEKIIIPKYFLRSSHISYVVLRGLFDEMGVSALRANGGLAILIP